MSKASTLHGQDIVCFSSIDWQFIWQGHQEIMSTLAANGNRVLFIENTGVRAPSFRDIPRIRQRLANWWRGTQGFRNDRANLSIYSPLLLPWPYSPLVRAINRVLLVRALKRWMRAAGFGRPIVWTFLPTPLVRDVIAELDPLATIYYCIDDFASSSTAARRIARSEQMMFKAADLVFVTSENLRAKAARFSSSVHLFPFGVSFQKFDVVRESSAPQPAELEHLKRPIIGYVGGVHRWVDQTLLIELATQMPDASFVMVGPEQTDVSVAKQRPNVHFLGKRAHDELPHYIKAFDVGIVPYVRSEYTANVYPTKLNEYLAMGIPVVATDLPEIRRFNGEHGPSVTVASTSTDFAAGLQRALIPATEAERARRIEVARENSWQSRIARMSELIEQQLIASRVRPQPWEAKLTRVYRRARGRVAAAVAALMVLYIAFFRSSLPWTLAEPLRMSDAPRSADAVVVFAGGVGESGEAGGGYQERVKQAVDLYRNGFARTLIFESGYVFAFREAEIMRDLAISLGIPGSDIILETSGANTYEDVVKVAEVLRTRGWRRILLVSSPYHMRRATLVWRKQAPEVEVMATPPEKTQFYAHDRGATLEQLRGLAHECVAIVWYWWKGWL